MNQRPLLAASLALSMLFGVAVAQEPAAADTFEREVLKSLKTSHEAKRSVTVHVAGATLSGVVTAIGPDVVVIGNRERARIMIRRERIDAVEAD